MSDKKEEFGDAERPQRPRRDGQGSRGDRSQSPRSGSSRQGDDRPRRSYGDRPNRDSGERRSYGDRPQGDRPYRGDRPARDGERRSYGDRPQRSDRPARDGEKREWKPREGGERHEYRPRDSGDRKPYGDRPQRSGPPRGDRPGYAPRDGAREGGRDGERRNYGDRPQRSDGDRREWKPREGGERREYKPRDSGDRKPFSDRTYGERPRRDEGERRSYSDRPQRSDGDRREWKPREGGERRSYGDRPQRDGERRSYGDRPQRGGERRSYGDRPQRSDRPQYGDRPRPNDRGERDERPELTPEQLRARELRMVRPRHDDPEIDPDVTQSMLDRVASNELKTLTKENAEFCAEHLVMAARLIDENPEQAHQHALSASRRGGRIGVIRETLAITAYASGDFALALRELRTFRRISGSNEQIALMVDSERGIGRPDRALELGRSVDRATLTTETQVALAIAMSGARLDLNQVDLALAELEIPQLDPKLAFSYSPALFRAYAEVLEELGRHAEAADWIGCAEIAEKALEEANPELDVDQDDIVVFEEEPTEEELVAEAESAVANEDALLVGDDNAPVDLDVLEDDVRQILEETKHLDDPKNRGKGE